VRIDKDIDLGHYRRVSVSFEGTDLLLFVPKSERMPADAPTVRPRRMLLYADGRLLGDTVPAPAAARRSSVRYSGGTVSEHLGITSGQRSANRQPRNIGRRTSARVVCD
jgi:hypothetical protein